MAVQTLAIIVWSVEFGFLRHRTQILHINMPEATEFRLQSAIHGVIGMASKTGLIMRHEMILIMHRRNKRFIIDQQAAAVVVHDMTGKTKLGGLGAFHMFLRA